jgi:hypothetical protein
MSPLEYAARAWCHPPTASDKAKFPFLGIFYLHVLQRFLILAPPWRLVGAMAANHPSETDTRQSLRLPANLCARLDMARAKRAGNVSRNTWIIEAVVEKLSREDLDDAQSRPGDRRA